jgi:hypothetical protein
MSASITAATSSAVNSTSIASTSAATSTSSESLPNFGATISGYFQAFAGQLHVLATGIDAAAALIAFYAGLILIPIGAILYWGHVSRRTGWGMFVGGIILIVFSYTVFPNLGNIAPP